MRTLLAILLSVVPLAVAAADAPRIASRYAPPPPVRVVEPRLLWRVTDGDEATGDILGEIRDVASDAAGFTYLLDTSFNTVRIYDPLGAFVQTVGREGEGPGEFRNPGGCLVLGDGRIGVMQLLPARIVTFTRDGEPGADLVPPGGAPLELLLAAQAAGQVVYLCTHTMTLREGQSTTLGRLQSLALDGTARAVFKEQSRDVATSGGRIALRTDSGDDFSRFWAAGPDGRVYVAPRYDAYEIEVYTPDGTLERVIDVAYDHVERTAAEIAALESRAAGGAWQGQGGRATDLDLGEVNRLRRDIDAIYPRPDGSLWIASSRGDRDRPAGAVGGFDVFDREGRFIDRVAIAADFDPDDDRFVLAGSRLYVLEEALNAPQSQPSAAGGGGAVVVRVGPARPRDPAGDERPPLPYAVVCYDLRGI